jgi:hypothetical protein
LPVNKLENHARLVFWAGLFASVAAMDGIPAVPHFNYYDPL